MLWEANSSKWALSHSTTRPAAVEAVGTERSIRNAKGVPRKTTGAAPSTTDARAAQPQAPAISFTAAITVSRE